MNILENGFWKFSCDSCGKIVATCFDEESLLDMTYEMIQQVGWKWCRPHFGLTCPDCEKNKNIDSNSK